MTDAETREVSAALAEAYDVPDRARSATSFIGPSWGADVTRQSLWGLAIFLALTFIILALYFRTWKMSVSAIIGLVDVLVITIGVYALFGFEISPAAVIGFLTILSYALYDTTVVFDKIRENTSEDGEVSGRTFGESVNLAVNQTLIRSINTTIVAILPTGAILFIGLIWARRADADRPLAVDLRRNDRRRVLDDLRRRAAVLAAARERAAHQGARRRASWRRASWRAPRPEGARRSGVGL